MYFHFGTRKIIEAAAVMLRLSPCQRMNYMRLLKLLYIADRESLKETGRPIIGTKTIAMERGPLHSEVYDLIKGGHYNAPMWAEFIHTDRYEVELARNPGVLHLSQYEIEKLTETARAYEDMDEWEVARATHAFDEWTANRPEGTSAPIPMEAILDAVGRSKDKDEILRDAEELRKTNRLLGVPA